MFSAAVWSAKPQHRFPGVTGPDIVTDPDVAAAGVAVFSVWIADRPVPPLVFAPVISRTAIAIPVRAVPHPDAVTTSFVGDAPAMPAHTDPEQTPDTKIVVACCEYVTPFPDTPVGCASATSVDDANRRQTISDPAAGVNDVAVAYDVAFVVVYDEERSLKTSGTYVSTSTVWMWVVIVFDADAADHVT